MKKLINVAVIVLLLSVMACSEHSIPTIEPNTGSVYKIEFKQDGNYKTVQKQLIFVEGMLLNGHNGKIIFTNDDLTNPTYIFETEGAPSNLKIVLRIQDSGSSDIAQFSFTVFENGRRVMNVTHLASGNATKEYQVSI